METILIISIKEMLCDSSRNYIRNKVRKFKNPFFDILFKIFKSDRLPMGRERERERDGKKKNTK